MAVTKLKPEEVAGIALFKKRWDDAYKAALPRFKYFREMQAVFDGVDEIPESVRQRLEAETKIPWAYWNWKTIEPRVADPAPRMDFKPTAPKDQRVSDVLKIIVKIQLEQGQFVMEQIPMLHDGGVLGFNCNEVIWHQKSETFEIRQPLTEEERASGQAVQPTFLEQTMITENWPLIRRRDPFDIFPDPKATNDQNWAYLFERVWLSDADMQQRINDGVYNKCDYTQPGETADTSGDDTDPRPEETTEEAEARRQGKHSVITMWGADRTRIAMCNGHLLRMDQNPFKHNKIPFVVWCTQPKANSLYGESEMEKLQKIQREIWISDTLRRDGYLKAQNSGFVADPNINIPKNRQAGFVIRAVQGQRLDELKFDANQGPSLTESDNLLNAMQEMSGAAGVAAFTDPASLNRMSATVGNITDEAGNMRMMWKKLWFRLMTSRAVKFMAQLDHQYLSEFEIQNMCGDVATDFKPLSPEEIPMFMQVIPEALSEQLGLLAERNSHIELLNIIGPMNGQTMPDGSMFTVKPVIEDTIKSYQKEPSRYFVPPPGQSIDPTTGAPITQLPMDPNTGLPIPQGPSPMQATPAVGFQPQQQQAQPEPGPAEDVKAMTGQPK